MCNLSFMEALIQGKAQPSDAVKYRQQWSRFENDSEDMTCYEYLGMTYEEYVASSAGDNHAVLMDIVKCHRQSRGIV